MIRILRPALVVFVLLTLVTGVVYPFAVTGVAQGFFRDQAEGSLIERDGRVVGSRLIGQNFSDPAHFWGRPSATAPMPYNAAASGGANLGPTNPALVDAVKARVQALREADPGNTQPVPIDLVTTSASGLDPHISPAAARFQAARVARLRQMPPATIDSLIEQHTARPAFAFLGEPRVDVLALNLALDALRPLPSGGAKP